MKRFKKQTVPSRAAFTLVELLVVIGVVALLAALLFPVIGRARDRSKQVGCMANLQAYGVALFAYLNDHDGSFPNWYTDDDGKNHKPQFRNWLVGKGKYLETELRCPLATRKELEDTRAGFRYSGNASLCKWEWFKKPLKINYAHSRIVFAAEMYGATDGFNSPTHFNMTVWGNAGEASKETDGKTRRQQYHGTPEQRRLNLLFLDGHMESVYSPKNNDWWINYPEGARGTEAAGPVYDLRQFDSIAARGYIKPL